MPAFCEFDFQDDQHHRRDEKHEHMPPRHAEQFSRKVSDPCRFPPRMLNHLSLLSQTRSRSSSCRFLLLPQRVKTLADSRSNMRTSLQPESQFQCQRIMGAKKVVTRQFLNGQRASRVRTAIFPWERLYALRHFRSDSPLPAVAKHYTSPMTDRHTCSSFFFTHSVQISDSQQDKLARTGLLFPFLANDASVLGFRMSVLIVTLV